jgi:hypothetical protein
MRMMTTPEWCLIAQSLLPIGAIKAPQETSRLDNVGALWDRYM